jgi:hypothetical protein
MIQRKKELLDIVKIISSQNNVIVYAPLFYGKTTLLQQLISQFEKEKIIYFFIDCKKCFDERSLLNEYSKEGLRVLSGEIAGAVKDAYQFLPNIKPSISTNSSKGAELSMSYNLTTESINKFVKDVLLAPYKISLSKNERIVVILDDYDFLLEIDNIDIYDLLAKRHNEGVSYILSTANLGIVNKIKEKEKKKYYIEDFIFLENFSENQVNTYLKDFFKNNFIDDSALSYLFNALQGDVKNINDFLYYYGKNDLTIRSIRRTINIIIERRELFYQQFFDSLSVHQKKLIIAIAKHTGKHVFMGNFIYENNLVSVPSVQTSIKGLIKKQFLHKDIDGFQITDILFREWLRRSFGV